MAPSPLIQLDRVRLGHHGRALGPAFDLRIGRGDFLVVAGPNGAGKSTLARTLMGVLPPVEGRRLASVEGRALRFGYVPQREHLDELWPFSALDIALMGTVPALGPFRAFGRGRRRAAQRILEQVGIGDLAEEPFRSLSGGQQQRALIARALAASPDVLVLDEPTNHLDVPGERAVYELLGNLHRAGAVGAVLVIAHHLEAVLPHTTHVVVVRAGTIEAGETSAMLAGDALRELRVTPPPPAMREAAR